MPDAQLPKSKHDAGCLRRKVEMDMPYVCTCAMTDQMVKEVDRRFRARAHASSTKDVER